MLIIELDSIGESPVYTQIADQKEFVMENFDGQEHKLLGRPVDWLQSPVTKYLFI